VINIALGPYRRCKWRWFDTKNIYWEIFKNVLFQCEFEYSHFSIFSEVQSKNYPIFWVGHKNKEIC
jgi:hypothetical protein